MEPFVTDRYGPQLRELLEAAEPGELGPGKPKADFRDHLSRLTAATVLGTAAASDADMAACCLSGLYLAHHFLDESHVISQDIRTTSGSYWHAIMHRREPDFPNAKYWYRQVGDHPIYDQLAADAAELAWQSDNDPDSRRLQQASWDPFLFVDLCQQSLAENKPPNSLCSQIAAREWQLLFDYCFHKASG